MDIYNPPFGDMPRMSLRDWFAGQALVGTQANARDFGEAGCADYAEYAYRMADAMLAERSKEAK